MPNVYEITDPDTGTIYRMEADEGVSQEEALADFEALGRDQWAAFEYNPQNEQEMQAPAPTPQESGPVSVSEEDLSGFEPQVSIPMDDIPVPEAETQTVARGALIDAPPRNPLERELSARGSQLDQLIRSGAPDEQVRAFARETEQSTGTTISGLEENLRRRREGQQTGEVQIGQTAFDRAFEPEQPEDPGDRTGLERLGDAFADARQYGFAGWVSRFGNDWMNNSKDAIREMFPGRPEEWYEEMHDYSIVQAQKKLRAEAQMLQDMDPNWRPDQNFFQNVLAVERYIPWFVGQIGGSAGPEMAIAPGASLAARSAAQTAIGAVSDLGYQGGDVVAGVEDSVSWESVALNGLMGAGGEVLMTGVARTVGLDSARGRGVNSTEVQNARFPRAMDELDQTIQPRTTHDRRTTAYRTETAAAQQSIADRINVLTQDWTNAPEFEVYDNFSSLKGVEDETLGVYRTITENGQTRSVVAMNTDQILAYAERNNVNPDDVVRSVVFHEALGHHGLASRYGAELDTVMDSFYTQGDADFRSRVDTYQRVAEESNTTLATEEVLAIMSERGELPIRMMDRLTTFFRGWAREIPWVGSRLKFTDNEVRTLLAMSQRETTQGAPRSGDTGVPISDKYMVAYHGSGADFDRFDHSFMSAGEGQQVFGWGTYLSDSRGIAEHYRDQIGGTYPEWKGQRQDWYQLRTGMRSDLMTIGRREGVSDSTLEYFADAIITEVGLQPNGKIGTYYKIFDEDEIDELLDPERLALVDMIKHSDQNVEIRSSGKVYEVDIPDDTRFLEWEKSLGNQPELAAALEAGGYKVTDYSTWNELNRDAYQARTTYENLNARLQELDNTLEGNANTGGRGPLDEATIARIEEEADEVFQRVKQASIVRNKAIERAKQYFHSDMTGEDVYGQLAAARGGAKEASTFLAENGIQGNRYLSNNLRKGRARTENGSDVFNYVMFDDSTPQVINKYMKPRDLQNLDSVRPEDLSADELFDSMNAFDILKSITPDGQRAVYNMDDLQSDAAQRGISPSALLKASTEGAGSLSKKLFMYDLAAQKMNDRVTRLYGKIQSGNYTIKDKDNYIKTLLQFEDLTAKIFDQQSEVGRALRAIQEMEFTRNRVTTLRDALNGLDSGLEALDDPATFEKFARQINEQLAEAQARTDRLGNPIIQTMNVPRAVMSSMDLSAPLRQGLFFMTKKAYWKAAKDMHVSFVSQGKYDNMMDSINSRPTYEAMIRAKLAFSRIDEGAPLSAREEDFQTDLAAQIPIIGVGVQASNRAYSGFRNQLAADMFDEYFDKMSKAGVNVGQIAPDDDGNMKWSGDAEAIENLRGMAGFVNAATGRGNLPEWLASSAPQLNAIFFSPRLIYSRLNLLNPVFYYKLPPVVRREAIIQAMAMGSLATLTLGALDHFLPEVDVETDWTHTDFGKVRVGNTRFDVLGGFAQFLRLGARLATGRMTSSTDRVSEYQAAPFIQGIHEGLRDLYEYSTGEVVAPSDPSNPAYTQTLKDAISQFLENKFAPNASYINDMLKGEDFIGEPFDPVDGALSRIMPMYFQDMAELASEDGPGPITTGVGLVASLYGVGSNTYVSRSLDPNQELTSPETMRDKDLADGENEWVTVRNGTITLKPQAREMYDNRLNTYFSQIMEFEMRQDSWPELERSRQAEIIREARAEAQREARKDMRRLFGVD